MPVLYTNLAANALDEASFFSTNASPSLLRAGVNVVAVEIHQAALTSTDMSFDLQLQAESGPVLSISRSGSMISLSWQPAVPGLQLQYAATLNGPWYVAPNQANPQSLSIDLPVSSVYWRLLVP